MTTPARAAAALAMARTSASRIFGRQAGFENVGDHQRLGARARNGQIVHRSVHRQFADGAAGKAQRLDDEAVGGDGDARSVHVDDAPRRPEARWTRRTAAARTGLPPAGGWLCLRRRAPSRFAGRGSGFWEAAAFMLCLLRPELPIVRQTDVFDARSCNTPRRSLPTKPSARPPDVPACIPCRTACTAPASARPSAPRRTAPLWDR